MRPRRRAFKILTMDGQNPMCPRFEQAAALLGKRWTGLILKVLMEGPKRFGELAHSVGALSERVLSERLKELEAEGVLVRRVEPGPPVRVAYELTEKGEALRHVIDAMGAWAEEWLPRPAVETRARAVRP
jgi:DNA-binding HxlR family transcriptional regulator